MVNKGALLDGAQVILDFIATLPPKIAQQITRKILALAENPFPSDSSQLKGYNALFRIDSGEYRIIYRYQEKENTVVILLIGKRNDDEVYRELRRKDL